MRKRAPTRSITRDPTVAGAGAGARRLAAPAAAPSATSCRGRAARRRSRARPRCASTRTASTRRPTPPSAQERPAEALHQARRRQVDEHQRRARRRQPVVEREQPRRRPRPAHGARPEVDEQPHDPEAEHAEHHQVGVPHDPVGEVDDLLERERRLERALEAGDDVEDHAREEPADRQVAAHRVGAAAQRHEEVHDHREHHHLDGDRRHHGAVLRVHRDGAEQEVVDALQRIEEGEAPEADQRQRMAPDRLPQEQRHEVVHQPPAERRDEEADEVVDVEAGDRRARRARAPRTAGGSCP